MTSSTATTTARFTPALPNAATPSSLQSSSLTLRTGQGQWLYLEAGSSLYCTAGQLEISSPWHSGLRLVAEEAPHCNGAHAGWYWLQAEGLQPAQLLVQVQAYAGWRAGWRGVANWLGWKD